MTVSSLANGTPHTFEVRARNSVGNGVASVEATATPTADNAAPTFTEGATATRNVAENAPAGTAVGNPLTATDTDAGDRLTYTREGTAAQSFTVVSDSGQIRTRSGVTYDHEATPSYSVTVRVSDGTASATIDVTIDVTDVDEPPRAPTLSRVTKTDGGTSVLVEWTAPPNTGRPDITGYDLRYRKQGSSGSWTNGPQNVSGTSTTIRNLNVDTEYEVQVRARNAEGDGPWSTEGSTPPPRRPPPPSGRPSPLHFTVTPGDRQLTVAWSAVPGADLYTVEWKTASQPYASLRRRFVEPPAYVIGYSVEHGTPSLENGTPYTVRMRVRTEGAPARGRRSPAYRAPRSRRCRAPGWWDWACCCWARPDACCARGKEGAVLCAVVPVDRRGTQPPTASTMVVRHLDSHGQARLQTREPGSTARAGRVRP